jgi:hypothetical protein
MTTYTNPFYSAKFDNSKPAITTEAIPIEYKGYLIYERVKKQVFDIVQDGVCIGMYAGINGAKRWLDTITEDNNLLQPAEVTYGKYKEQTLF